MFVVVVIQTPGYARLVRTATLAKKNSEFILAERSLGAGPLRILAIHILPNIVGPLFIIGSMDIPSVITLEAGLTYPGPRSAAAGAQLGPHPLRRLQLHPRCALDRA